MKKVLGCLSMAALAVILAAPVSAQSTAVRANVPFDFMVGGRTLPAGAYEFGLVSSGRGIAGDEPSPAPLPPWWVPRRAAKLPVAPTWWLSSIATGTSTSCTEFGTEPRKVGREIPASRIERELASRASADRPETVMVLARL